MKLKRLAIRKLLEESVRREKEKKLHLENLRRKQRRELQTLNESLLAGSAEAMGDFIMISDGGKVIRSPNTVKGVARASSKAIFSNNTIPTGCKGLYRVIGVDGGEAIVARVSVKTGEVLTRQGFAETIKVSKDAVTRSSVLYMNGLRGSEYKLVTDTGKVVGQNASGAPAVVDAASKSTNKAVQKVIEKSDKLLPVEKIMDATAKESAEAIHTNAAKAISPAAQQAAASSSPKVKFGASDIKMKPGSGASSTASAAASNVDRGRATVKALQKGLQDPKYYKMVSEELADTTLSKAITTSSGRVIPKGAIIDAILPDGTMVFKAGTPAGFKGLTVTASTTQQLITKPGPVRDAFSNAIQAQNAASGQVAKTAAAETGEELAKTGAQSAEAGLAKTGAETAGKTAIQKATGTTEIVVADLAEGAIAKGGEIAKGAPQLEAAVVEQFVKAGGGEISEEVAKQGAHGLLGSLPADDVAEVVAKNAGQETAEVAVSASGKFVTGLAKALGPTIVLAFGFYELYNAFTNDEYNDEQFYDALALAAGNMTVGFGTLVMATPAFAAGYGLAGTLAVAFGSTIAASAAGAAGYFLGKTFNDYMSVDTSDLFVSIGRQAADRVGVLDTGMFTKWHEEDEWAEDFIEAAAEKDFKGLNPKDVDEKRRGALFNILAIERTMMLAGEKLMNATGENAEIAKKLRSLFDKGFLNSETWYPEFKKMRKGAKIAVKPAEGGEKQGGGKVEKTEDQAAEKKGGSGAASAWDSYISKTKDSKNAEAIKILWLGNERFPSSGEASGKSKSYGDYVKWYKSLYKTGEIAPGYKIKPGTKIGASSKGWSPGTHLNPKQVQAILRQLSSGDYKNSGLAVVTETRYLEDLLWESILKRKIIKTQKLINLIS